MCPARKTHRLFTTAMNASRTMCLKRAVLAGEYIYISLCMAILEFLILINPQKFPSIFSN